MVSLVFMHLLYSCFGCCVCCRTPRLVQIISSINQHHIWVSQKMGHLSALTGTLEETTHLCMQSIITDSTRGRRQEEQEHSTWLTLSQGCIFSGEGHTEEKIKSPWSFWGSRQYQWSLLHFGWVHTGFSGLSEGTFMTVSTAWGKKPRGGLTIQCKYPLGNWDT